MVKRSPSRLQQAASPTADPVFVDINQPAPIQVLYSDTALLVVNKPAGLSTLPDGYNPSLPHMKSILEREFGRLWVVHRLDKQTSGVLIFARSSEAHRVLSTQFEHHRVFKVYHALVVGEPPWQDQVVDLPLRPNGDRRHRTVVDLQAGKPAVTHFSVIERFACFCLLEARPETGRTHQIRAHLASLGFSIVSDKLYAVKNDAQDSACLGLGLEKGMGLHARLLEIDHPQSAERMKFTAPYPQEWDNLLSRLRRGDSPH